MQQLLVHLPLLLSIAAFGIYLAFIIRGDRRLRRVGHVVLATALTLITLQLVYRYTAVYPSVTYVGGFEALLFIALSVGLVSALGAEATGIRVLPMVAAPVVALCLAGALFRVRHHAAPQPDITPAFIIGHVVPSLWGYTAFALAFVVAGVYLLQERSLKRHRFGALFEGLPSLVTLERGIVRLLTIGFGFFTVSILVGILGTRRLGLESWIADSKVILSAATWLLYAIVLAARFSSFLHGRRVALASIIGMAMILITFVVVETVWPGWHAYGWKTSAAAELPSSGLDPRGAAPLDPAETREP